MLLAEHLPVGRDGMSSDSIVHQLRRCLRQMGTFRIGLMASTVFVFLMIACGNDTAVIPADTAPPVAPVGLAVDNETGDLVQITWSPNAEPDLAGYRVYRSHGEDGPFSQVSVRMLVCPWFYEHVSPMETACFKVTAVDLSGNESAFSQPVGVYLNNGWRNPPSDPQQPR
jgi:hypothetical protein